MKSLISIRNAILKKDVVKHLLFGLGILLTIVGWCFKNADRYQFVYRIFVPDYYDALAVADFFRTFEDTHDCEFTSNRRGFRALAGYVVTFFSDGQQRTLQSLVQSQQLSVEKVTIHGGFFDGRTFSAIGPGIDERGNAGNYRYVSAILKDRIGNLVATPKARIVDFDNKLLSHYRGNTMIVALETSFWIGLVITIASHFIKNRRTSELPCGGEVRI
jgi:hypothetical protein